MSRNGGLRTVLLCEDVRREIGNKRTLVGVLAGDILVPSFPSFVNFGVYIEYVAVETGSLDFHVEVFAGEKKLYMVLGQMLITSTKLPSVIDIPKVAVNVVEPIVVRV